jgi:hypothetical protein
MDFRRLKKMCRDVRQAISSRWRDVTILGLVLLCLALPVPAGAQKTTDIPPLESDKDAAGQAREDASAPRSGISTTTVAAPASMGSLRRIRFSGRDWFFPRRDWRALSS